MPATRPFSNFPKRRDPLPPEFEAIYTEHYKTNRDGSSAVTSVAQRMEGWMHKKVAEDVGYGSAKSTLEIGAGTLNHLAHEPFATQYDIVEPFSYLYEKSSQLRRVGKIYSDVSEIPRNRTYSRIISIATFEHICNLPETVALSGLLLSGSGQLRIAIPSEGTLFWRLGWQLTTGVEFRLKHNLDYGVMMRYEHVNTATEIEDVLHYFFRRVTCSVFGISKSLSFYQFYACSNPNLERCSFLVDPQSQ